MLNLSQLILSDILRLYKHNKKIHDSLPVGGDAINVRVMLYSVYFN